MGLRGQRLEVKGWGDGIIDTQSMQIHCPHENATEFFTETRFQKKCVHRHSVYRIHMYDRPKRCKTCVYTQKHFHVHGPLE